MISNLFIRNVNKKYYATSTIGNLSIRAIIIDLKCTNLYFVMNMHEMLSYKTILSTHDCILLFNDLVQFFDEIVYNDLGHAFTAPSFCEFKTVCKHSSKSEEFLRKL